MNRDYAVKIYSDMENEMRNLGGITFSTANGLKKILPENEYLNYFYMQNGKLIFNSKRWKRRVIDGKGGDITSPPTVTRNDNAEVLIKEVEILNQENIETNSQMKELGAQINQLNNEMKQYDDISSKDEIDTIVENVEHLNAENLLKEESSKIDENSNDESTKFRIDMTELNRQVEQFAKELKLKIIV